MDKRIVSGNIQEDELINEKNLRPKKLSEYIGQDKIKSNLEISIAAAKKGSLVNKKITANIGAAIRLQMKNQTSIIGTKGSILINDPWLPNKKSAIEISSKERTYKSLINSELDIYAN